LSRWLKPEEARLERSAIYTFHSVVAEGWRAGRLLIAGDAAHQTPPFMGQGMCAGIRDAANLAWKLADVVQGLSDDALLDTYESERSPHAQVFINEAVRLGSIIRALNDRVTGGADGGEPDRFVTPQPRLGPGAYDDREPGGRIAEQPLVREGVRLDDLVGYRSVLLAREQPRAMPNTDTDDLMVLVAPPGPCLDWLDRLDGFAVLIRPDRYIFGVARSSHDCAGLIDRYRTARWRRAPADRPLGAKQ
jgi:3-(3-hydroxy-phenyl)propionate hydroxylase